MRLARLVLSLIAVSVAAVLGLRLPTEWYGEVYTNGTQPVEAASVLLIKESRVTGSTTTSSDGKFMLPAGPHGASDRVVVCKRGFEAATIETRPPRRRPGSAGGRGSVVQLVVQNLDVEEPFVASLRSVLPSECL